MSRRVWTVLPILTLAAGACTCTGPVTVSGRRIFDQAAGSLQVSPEGEHLAWLGPCAVDGAEGVLRCDLQVATLTLARPRRLATEVSFHRLGPNGTLGFISKGTVYVVAGDDSPVKVSTGDSFQFSPIPWPRGGMLVESKGGLASGAGCRLLLEGRPSEALAGSRECAFSASGRWVAFTGCLGRQDTLCILDVTRPDEARVVGASVVKFAFATRTDLLGWLENGSPGGGLSLWVRTPGREDARRLAKGMLQFRLSPDGATVAGLDERRTLYVVPTTGAGKPQRIGGSVADFAFAPGGDRIAYRPDCVVDLCNLFSMEVEAGVAHSWSKVAGLVTKYLFHPTDPGTLLLWADGGTGPSLTVLKQRPEHETRMLAANAEVVDASWTTRGVAYSAVAPRVQGIYLVENPFDRHR